MSDRIEKEVLLDAPIARVWQAISRTEEFGAWFGVNLDGEFAAGKTVRGKITTPGYEHLTMEMDVERMDDKRLFSYRWHPHAVDPKIDYSGEPTTLVEFRLAEAPGGTRLSVTESGFEMIPAGRRAEALRMNEGGWAEQIKKIQRYITR